MAFASAQMQTRNMKSLQLGMHWFPERSGGLDRVYYSLIQSLPQAGVEVRGLVTGKGQAEKDTEGRVRSFAKADDFLGSRLLAARSAIREEVRVFRPDSVAIHFALYAVLGMRELADTPSVMHFHGPWAFESMVENPDSFQTRIKQAIERRVYRNTTRQVVLSKAFGAILSEKYGVPSDTIDVIPGGVDVTRYESVLTRNQAREKLNLPLDRPIVVVVRRLVRRMGLEDLLDALVTLRKKWPDLLVVVAGRGALREELEARAQASGVTDSLKFTGYVADEDLPLLYRAADLSIVPTVALEGFGLITVESLASGTPVLVTPVGGLPEVVTGLCADLVLPSTGAAAIVDGIDGFLSGALKLPDSAACNAYARANFDLPVMARRTVETYRKAAA